LLKFIGIWGFRLGLIFPALLILGAVIVLFVIMSQISYPICLAIYAWCSGTHPTELDKQTFKHFSASYTAIILFFVGVGVCSLKNLRVFIKMGSFGALFVTFLLIFIITTGIISLTNTEY
jgi:hypothetical protein